MEIIISLILGAILGAGGLLYWQRRRPAKPPELGVKIQGGGPGTTPPPPGSGGDE